MSDGITAPVIAGLAVGIGFIVLFSLIFTSITPIIPAYNQPLRSPLPEIRMTYNGSEYATQAVTFSWERDTMHIGNVSEALSLQNITTSDIPNVKQGNTVAFAIYGDIDDNNSNTTLPVDAVYVYEYPTNDFEGTLLRLFGNTFLVDLQKGDYYLRANYQQNNSGSVSYYFRVVVDVNDR